MKTFYRLVSGCEGTDISARLVYRPGVGFLQTESSFLSVCESWENEAQGFDVTLKEGDIVVEVEKRMKEDREIAVYRVESGKEIRIWSKEAIKKVEEKLDRFLESPVFLFYN